MKKLSLLACIAVLCASTSVAQAQSSDWTPGLYVQAGVVPLTLKYNQYNYALGTTATVAMGYDFHKNLAGEVLYARTSTTDYSTTLSFAAFYLKPKYQINDTFEVHGKVGTNNMTIETTYGAADRNFTSYGVGMTAYISDDKKNFLSVDYMVWGKNNGYSLVSPSLTFGRKF